MITVAYHWTLTCACLSVFITIQFLNVTCDALFQKYKEMNTTFQKVDEFTLSGAKVRKQLFICLRYMEMI